ncbi:MAG: hypothetical protein J6N71_08385 [Muribaculaceae bacterium]|nr:hypothetical protein [Muribaculaceae bacterium]
MANYTVTHLNNKTNYSQELDDRIITWKHKLLLSGSPTERRTLGGLLLPDELTKEEHELLTAALQATFAGKTTDDMLNHCFAIDTPMYVAGTVRIVVRDLPSKQIVTWLTDEEAKQRETLCPKCKPFNEIRDVLSRYFKIPGNIERIVSKLIRSLDRLRDNLLSDDFFLREEEYVPFTKHLIEQLKNLLYRDETRELLMEYELVEPLTQMVELLKELLQKGMAETEMDDVHVLLTDEIHDNPGVHDLSDIYPKLLKHTDWLLARLQSIRLVMPGRVSTLCAAPVEPVSAPAPGELNPYSQTIESLGRYVKATDQTPPTIEIDLDKIDAQAVRDGVPRKYLVTMVVVHEMIHALLDRFPYDAKDCYIPEIDEAFAEYGMLHAVCSLHDVTFMQYASKHVYNKRFDAGTRLYSLGWELFLLSYDCPRLLAYYYTRRHRDELFQRPLEPTDFDKKALETLVESFRASFPVDRAKATIALKSILSLIKVRNTDDAVAAIDECLAVSYCE